MNYYKDTVEEYEDIEERFRLIMERIRQIAGEEETAVPFMDYFSQVADFFLQLSNILLLVKEDTIDDLPDKELSDINKKLFFDVLPENYEKSFCNPLYTKSALGDLDEEHGGHFLSQYLSFIYYEIKGLTSCAFEGRIADITLWAELFVEIYVMFRDEYSLKSVHEAVYYFENDYAEFFMTNRVREKLDPVLSFATDIVMDSDLTDTSYLYKYGEYIGENEIKTAKFLNTLSQSEIDDMARTYTEGYRLGFVAAGIDLSKKKTVNVRYPIGMERMVRAAIVQFRDMGLDAVCYRYDTNRINKNQMARIGYTGTPVNKQMDYDHRMDNGLFLDKKLAERKLEVMKAAYEKYAYEASVYAGPACIDIFGETPFVPENKPFQVTLTEKQREINVDYTNELAQVIDKYIPGDEVSFTIIAYPMPEIGDNYEEIFAQIVKINNLDNDLYRKVQQVLINELDRAVKVRVEGKDGNKTDITVAMHELKNPDKETNFENCVADVNIPVGEVFTSPKLTGTNGILNVSEVYLDDLKYINLTLKFKDGKIEEYTCDNFDTEEENRRFIKDNLLSGRDTLPIGEFAIGTNTTAYVIANKYDIVYKLPILIVEKMGPHFAVGDTCYSRSEDNILHNPDGKEIVAKENECSALRKTDVKNAYFNCHTDITIPYDEIGGIYSVHADGTEVPVILNGRFTLKGTEMLNEAFEM